MMTPLAVVAAGSVRLVWIPSIDANVVGYNLYYGGASRTYTNKIPIGNGSSATISNLVEGGTYYFAATGYDANGVESDFSNECMYSVPMNATGPGFILQSPSVSGGQFSFSVTGMSGLPCAVEASSNMIIWVRVATNQPPFTFVETNSGQFARRFYRTVYRF
jgi:hypothetical protein